MGIAFEQQPVRRFVSILASRQELFPFALSSLAALFGGVLHVTRSRTWHFSPLYERELGHGILQRIAVFQTLAPPDGLSDWKNQTNELEVQLAIKDSSGLRRSINLDPGYLSTTHVILGSTKNYRNRVYLRNGVFADLTLGFDGRSFRANPDTFPEYRTRWAIAFFNQMRRDYLVQLKENPTSPIEVIEPIGQGNLHLDSD